MPAAVGLATSVTGEERHHRSTNSTHPPCGRFLRLQRHVAASALRSSGSGPRLTWSDAC